MRDWGKVNGPWRSLLQARTVDRTLEMSVALRERCVLCTNSSVSSGKIKPHLENIAEGKLECVQLRGHRSSRSHVYCSQRLDVKSRKSGDLHVAIAYVEVDDWALLG
jgi:hypothetical protein